MQHFSPYSTSKTIFVLIYTINTADDHMGLKGCIFGTKGYPHTGTIKDDKIEDLYSQNFTVK